MEDFETIELKNGHELRIYQDEDPLNPRTEWDNTAHMACWYRDYMLGDKQKRSNKQWEPIHDNVEDMLCSITGCHPDDEEFQEETDNDGKIIKPETSYKDAMNIIWKRAHEKAVILPLSLYVHSGMTMFIGHHDYTFDPGGWDTSYVGFIYMTYDEARSNWVTDQNDTVEEWYGSNKGQRIPLKDVMIRVMEGEVKTYDDYLTGNVYGFKLIKKTVVPEKTWVNKDDPTENKVEPEHVEEEELDECWGFFGHDWRTNGIVDNIPDDLFTEEQLKNIKQALQCEEVGAQNFK